MDESTTQAEQLRKLFIDGLAARPAPREVRIPKILGDRPVYVSHLSVTASAEMDRLREQCKDVLEPLGENNSGAVLLAFVCLRDYEGNRLFTNPEDIRCLCSLAPRVLTQVIDLVNEANDEFTDQTRKNS
jgi:hypothetical protein